MSEVSQEDHKEEGERCCGTSLELLNAANDSGVGTIMEPQNLGDAQITAVASTASGRVSPGGTIYKGKGVRRYQGRYVSFCRCCV